MLDNQTLILVACPILSIGFFNFKFSLKMKTPVMKKMFRESPKAGDHCKRLCPWIFTVLRTEIPKKRIWIKLTELGSSGIYIMIRGIHLFFGDVIPWKLHFKFLFPLCEANDILTKVQDGAILGQ